MASTDVSSGKGVGSGKGKVESKKRKSRSSGNKEGEGEGTLREQAEELVRLMRRSVILHEAKARKDFEPDGDFDADGEAARRVNLVELAQDQAEDAEWAMEFFEDVLGR